MDWFWWFDLKNVAEWMGLFKLSKREEVGYIFMEINRNQGIIKVEGDNGPHFLALKLWTHTFLL
jgi:hypothetical protein